MGRACNTYGENNKVCRFLLGKPEGKSPLGGHRLRQEDNIKIDVRELGYGGMDWINLTQERDQWKAFVSTFHKVLGSS
jgi:hypothetical protein